MRLGHTGEKSLQALGKRGSLEGASTCNMEFGEYGVLNKKTKVKFDTATHRRKVFFIEFTLVFGDLLRLHRLEVIGTLSLLLIIYRDIVG